MIYMNDIVHKSVLKPKDVFRYNTLFSKGKYMSQLYYMQTVAHLNKSLMCHIRKNSQYFKMN
jgi:hypothetical protein